MKAIISLTLAALVTVCTGKSPNYCDVSLCPIGTTHIACYGPVTMSSTCGPGSYEVTLNSTYKNLILDLHNQMRSNVSLGKVANEKGQLYKQAAKMATLHWDQELANIAAANARHCVFRHDKCRSTVVLRGVGQNIGMNSLQGLFFTNEQLITDFVYMFYNESKYANESHMASYPDNYEGPAIGHFTQLASDRSSKIGCSMVSYNRDDWVNKLMVCNYGLTNMINQPVYVAGTACSGCTTGCNPDYPGLCSAKEVFRE